MGILALLIRLLLAGSAAAAVLQERGSGAPGVDSMWDKICEVLPFCDLDADSAPSYFASKIVGIVQSLITSVAIMFILWASILISISQDNEEKRNQAKRIIIYALLGIILAMISGAFLQYLLDSVFPTLFGDPGSGGENSDG